MPRPGRGFPPPKVLHFRLARGCLKNSVSKSIREALWHDTVAFRGLRCGSRAADYPLLSGGGTNLYSLFVERAMTLARSDGMVGLVVPSGIAADRTAARFFRTVSTTGRLKALYDFENGRSGSSEEPFFRDVHRSFKFSIFVAGWREGAFPKARCAFYVRDMAELEDPERRFDLTPEDFARVNPNTATAPVFLTRRDAALTTAIQCLPENPVFFR